MTNAMTVDLLRNSVSVTEAATLLGVTRPTVYAMLARGELTKDYCAGRFVIVRDEKYLAAEAARRG